jgi:hypothetical protein
MSIPDVIVADRVEELQGVIYKIREAVTNDNIINYVEPTSNYPGSGINNTVKWDGYWASGDNQNVYLLIDFKDRFIFPTHYSIMGLKGHCFAKEWILYGLNSTNGSPVEITRNTSVGSIYCGDPSTCGNGCCNDNWGTFRIDSPTRAFRYIKMMSLASSCASSSRWYMTMRGFEVFGILSKDGKTSFPRKTFYIKSCPMNSHLPAYVFFRLLSVFIS